MKNMRVEESELHLLGKAVFEDAEGKKICLPPHPSPRYNPPLEHTVKKVEFEKELPYVGYYGRRADVVLTTDDGLRIVVEVKNTHGKGAIYVSDLGGGRALAGC